LQSAARECTRNRERFLHGGGGGGCGTGAGAVGESLSVEHTQQ